MIFAVPGFGVITNLLGPSRIVLGLGHIGRLHCIPEPTDVDGGQFHEGIPEMKSVLEVRGVNLQCLQIIVPRSAEFFGLKMAKTGGAVENEGHLCTQFLEISFRCSLRSGPLAQPGQSSFGIRHPLFGGFRSSRRPLEVSKNRQRAHVSRIYSTNALAPVPYLAHLSPL